MGGGPETCPGLTAREVLSSGLLLKPGVETLLQRSLKKLAIAQRSRPARAPILKLSGNEMETSGVVCILKAGRGSEAVESGPRELLE